MLKGYETITVLNETQLVEVYGVENAAREIMRRTQVRAGLDYLHKTQKLFDRLGSQDIPRDSKRFEDASRLFDELYEQRTKVMDDVMTLLNMWRDPDRPILSTDPTVLFCQMQLLAAADH